MALLRAKAARRWEQKVHFARLRVQRLGWTEACHHSALEILGYRFNRATMLRVAGRWPLAAWTRQCENVWEEALAGEAGAWSVQGVRPANQPRNRLRQYAARPDWPEGLAQLGPRLPEVSADLATGVARRQFRLGALRREMASAVCTDAITGTRFDNLVCDGLLPLLAVHGAGGGLGLWSHWFPGDLPPFISRTLRELGVFAGRMNPACHGPAQGLLGWLVDFERQSYADGGSGA
jgi:hypothetical protein